MSDKSYIMYHCHSDYSLLDSATKYNDYIDLAVRDGSKAISISEHGKPLNWTEKWGACKAAGIRYIHSVEIYLTESLFPKVRDNYHTVLLARNLDGVRELNKLVTKSCNKDHFYYVNRISFDEFLGISDNIISTSACLSSPLNKLDETDPYYSKLLHKYTFLEVQPHLHPDQIAFNKKLYALSLRYGIPLIAGTDTHNSSRYKSDCRLALMSSKNKSYGEEDGIDLTYKTYDELVDAFRAQGALPVDVFMMAIENTNKLYDMTEDFDLDTSIKYPILHGSREKDVEVFRDTVESMFLDKVHAGIIPEAQVAAFRSAISEEMRVFEKLGMSGFMLSMSELVRWCKSQGMAIGTARGSVGGSRVAYITDIIDLNPETWNTIFSRFCNESRKEIGDIDIDCVESDRPRIFEYIVNRFGADKTARVASFGTIKSKGVIDDVGRHLAKEWTRNHPNESDNPWSLKNIARIKTEFDEDPEKTKKKYKELFYYYDGLLDVKISQSVHPAGMVISPITLPDNYGVFDKDDDMCLMLDMENVHDYTGLAKYDFLVLKTVQVIRDTCNYIGIPYPRTHEINWNDHAVWDSMCEDSTAIFQMEGNYAWQSLKKFRPQNIYEMALVNACIRPSGESYRDELLARKRHKNPSRMIDELLKDGYGYLVFQEDTIQFLQQICGLSGSDADTIRRAIGRKKKDILDREMPRILDGYCAKSDQPREIAESEAKEFIQILEDSASYQFGKNHAIAYCLMGYLCAYFRYYYPIEFITAFLNNAANDEDIQNGTTYAGRVGIIISSPKWGVSGANYHFDKDKNMIAKGLSSIKYIGESVADQILSVSTSREFERFIDVLTALKEETSINARQIEILVGIDFFSGFGNQKELLKIIELFNDVFKSGAAKKIPRAKVDGTPIEPVVKRYSLGETKTGAMSKAYVVLDIMSIIRESEDAVKSIHMEDFDSLQKARRYNDALGYPGFVSGNREDARKLFITGIIPVKKKKGFGISCYVVHTKSIGSGKESAFIIHPYEYQRQKFGENDIILLNGWSRSGRFFRLDSYQVIDRQGA